MPPPMNPFGGGKAGRQPSFKDAFQVDTVDGALRVRAWPRSRGKPKTLAEKERQDRFRDTQKSFQYAAPQMVADIMKAVEGTPLLPRDIWTHMLYGRAVWIELDDGRKLYPRMISEKVSEALDSISQTPGDMLIRTPAGWGHINLAAVPSATTWQGAPQGIIDTVYSDPYRVTGCLLRTPLTTKVGRVDCLMQATQGLQIQGALCRVPSGGLVAEVLELTEIVQATTAGRQTMSVQFTETLIANERYLILIAAPQLGSGATIPIVIGDATDNNWQSAPLGGYRSTRGYSWPPEPGFDYSLYTRKVGIFPRVSPLV